VECESVHRSRREGGRGDARASTSYFLAPAEKGGKERKKARKRLELIHLYKGGVGSVFSPPHGKNGREEGKNPVKSSNHAGKEKKGDLECRLLLLSRVKGANRGGGEEERHYCYPLYALKKEKRSNPIKN